MKMRQSLHGLAPKLFNSVDIFASTVELIFARINFEMTIKAIIYKTIVATSSVCMRHAVGVNFASNYGLKSDVGGVGDDLGVDAVPRL